MTALHNHMLDDQPRLFFMHFWANDDAQKLAKGLRARSRQDQYRPQLGDDALAVVVLLIALFCMTGTGRAAEPPAPLVLERTIALKGVTGRIDHLAVDLARKRLFVAELGNGTVDVIDLAAGNVIRRIEGLKEPQGLAYAPAADILAVASAGDGSVRLFRGAELSPAGTVDLGDDADNIRLDARTGNLVVGYGSGGLAVIDPAKASLLSRIPLPAHPEGFQPEVCICELRKRLI